MKTKVGLFLLSIMAVCSPLVGIGIGICAPAVKTIKPKEIHNIQSLKEEMFFGQPVGIRYDKDHIYILDMLDSEIRVFLKNGEYLRSIGRKGKGPAEFDGATDFCVWNGKIFVVDAGSSRIQILDHMGKSLGGFVTNKRPYRIAVLDEKTIIVTCLSVRNPGEKSIQAFSFLGKPLWNGIEAVFDDHPALMVMKNKHFIKAGMAGVLFVRSVDDQIIHYLDEKGGERKIEIDKGRHTPSIVLPNIGGKRVKMSSICWEIDVFGDHVFLLDGEISRNDLVSGRVISVLDQNGVLIEKMEFPMRIVRFSIDNNRIYILDSDFQLRVFEREK